MTVQSTLTACIRLVIAQLGLHPGDVTFLSHFERTNSYAIILPPQQHTELERLEALGYNILIKTTTDLLLTSLVSYLQRWLSDVQEAQLLPPRRNVDDLPKRS